MTPERFWDTAPLMRDSFLAPLEEARSPAPDTVELPRRPRAAAQALPPVRPLAPVRDRGAWRMALLVSAGVLAVTLAALSG